MAFCYYCMKERTVLLPSGACPVCHRDIKQLSKKQSEEALMPGTVLVQEEEYYIVVGAVVRFSNFGFTYAAIEKENDKERRIAIKEYFPQWAGASRGFDGKRVEVRSHARDSFKYLRENIDQEARQLTRLEKRPNITDVYFLISDENNTSYIGMEFFEGIDLDRFLKKRGGPMAFADALLMLKPIFEVLYYCQMKGIEHRSVEPENILIASDTDGVIPLAGKGLPGENAEKVESSNPQHKIKEIKFTGFEGKDYVDVDYEYPDDPEYLFTCFDRENSEKTMECIYSSDIHDLSATLYFLITGQRHSYYNEMVPEAYGAVITAEQSRALMKGMTRSKDKVQTIPDLWQALNLLSTTEPPIPSSDMYLSQINGNFFHKNQWSIHDRAVAGRDPETAQIYLKSQDETISPKHCLFLWNGEKWIVIDLSDKGTSVNGKLIPRQTNWPLADGDTIAIGSYAFKVVIRQVRSSLMDA